MLLEHLDFIIIFEKNFFDRFLLESIIGFKRIFRQCRDLNFGNFSSVPTTGHYCKKITGTCALNLNKLRLRFLPFFTCVSWGISPAQILLVVHTTAIRHSIFYFYSFFMCLQSGISKSVVICSFCSFLCSFLISIFSILFFSTLLSIPCSVFSLCLFTLFSDLPYCFLFKSVILSFLFSYYSVLSASPLCSVPIQSVLFLLVFILLDTSI